MVLQVTVVIFQVVYSTALTMEYILFELHCTLFFIV